MEAARPGQGRPGRRLWFTAAGLTAAGLVGALIDFLGFIGGATSGGLSGGCALGGMAFVIVFVALVVVVVLLGFVASIASLGLALLWRLSLWGAPLLIATNLLVMAFYALSPLGPGHAAWGIVIIAFAAAPAVAVVLLLSPLLTHGPLSIRVLAIVVLGAVAVPLLGLWAGGINNDLTAFSSPPSQVAQSQTRPCGATQ